MIKKTSGFNFSGASVSTCLWRGVLVRDILLASGLQDQPDEERWYVECPCDTQDVHCQQTGI